MFKKHGTCRLCADCGNSFQNEAAVRRNFVLCKVPSSYLLFVDRAERLAKNPIDKNVVPIFRHASDNPDLRKMVVSEQVKRNIRFPLFWAKRPARGETLGPTFVAAFNGDIRDMVKEGTLD